MATIYACFDVTCRDDDGNRVILRHLVVRARFARARTLRESIENARLAALMEAHVEDRRQRGIG